MTWRILAIDDELFNLHIIAEFLDSPRYELDLVSSADSAWEKLREILADPDTAADRIPHLIILDRMMPGMNGIEMLRRLKGEPRLHNIPVILQTAADSPDQVRDGIEAGAYYYLTKPYEPETLQALVRSTLAQIRLQQEADQSLASRDKAVRLLQLGEFRFATLEEAQDLAALLAVLSPAPDATVTGLYELMLNAIEHGNLEIGYKEKMRLLYEDTWEQEVERRLSMSEYAGRKAVVRVERSPAGLSYTITDQGSGFDWKTFLGFDADRAFDPNGRGIALAQQVSFDKIEYQGCGNIVVATIENES